MQQAVLGSAGEPEIVGADGPMNERESEQVVDAAADEAPHVGRLESMVSLLEKISDVPLYSDNRVELLIDGPQTYEHMLRSIAAARHYILLESYIFADDEVGRRFAEALAQRRSQGVHVFVIYDSIGIAGSDDTFFDAMEEHDIGVVEHNAINPLEGGNPLKINNRDHRKILVVDGEIGYLGGINFSRTYASSSRSSALRDPVKEGWRDTHIAVEGPAVSGFQVIFRDSWDHPDIRLPHWDENHVSGEDPGNQLLALLSADGEEDEVSNIYVAYMEAMRQATERIWVTQAYFAPDKDFLDTLRAAALRGVDVRLLLPGVSDVGLILDASRSRYDDLLAAGIRIYETSNSMLHAKTAVIDGVWSTVGSSNLDYRSFLHNNEINAVILGREFGEVMERQFRQDLQQGREITLAEWRERSILERFRESLAWVVEYWL